MEKLIIGKEYILNDTQSITGIYLGRSKTERYCFSSKNNNGYFTVTREQIEGTFHERTIAFYSYDSDWKETPSKKERIKELVEQMLELATPEQIAILASVFPADKKELLDNEYKEYRVFMTRTVTQQAMIVLEAKNMTEAEAMALKTVEEEDWEVQDEGEAQVIQVELED